ncbi:hypothetical protein T484DRAFT_1789476 [Baffinella frigidus]|nr:hypothetical protein T484DRAFT_1789476 [Cryptophyta sp. CCMP2293]
MPGAERAVFIGNIAWADEEKLRAHFAPCGTIEQVILDHDRETNDFKRSGRVIFDSSAAVEEAIKLEGSYIDGFPRKPLRVTYAVMHSDIERARKHETSARKMKRGGNPDRPGKLRWREMQTQRGQSTSGERMDSLPAASLARISHAIEKSSFEKSAPRPSGGNPA